MKLEDIVTKLKSLVDKNAGDISTISTKTNELDGRAPLIRKSAEVTNFDNCTQFGIYQSNSASSNGWNTSESWKTVITVPMGDSNKDYPVQIGFAINSQSVYIRAKNGASGWSAWKQLH